MISRTIKFCFPHMANGSKSIFTFRALILVCVGFGIFAVAPLVGQASEGLTQVDEFDPRQGCETLERRLDSLFFEATNDTQATAYVVVHQGNNFFDNAIVLRKATGYANVRRFPPDRYAVIVTKGSDDIKVVLWLGKNGKTPQAIPSDPAVKISVGVFRTQVAEDTLEFVKIDGRETYIGTGNPSCLYWFNPHLISELLKTNSDFGAELRIRTKSSKSYKKLVENLKDDFQEAGASIERIRFVYDGRDKELGGGGVDLASVKTVFVRRSRS